MFSRKPALILAAAAMAGIGMPVVASSPGPVRSPRSSRPRVVYTGHNGLKPHQNEREIARRLRQAERDEQRQRARASMVTAIPADRAPSRVSRRWRWMA